MHAEAARIAGIEDVWRCQGAQRRVRIRDHLWEVLVEIAWEVVAVVPRALRPGVLHRVHKAERFGGQVQACRLLTLWGWKGSFAG